jgi:hypothetical protein
MSMLRDQSQADGRPRSPRETSTSARLWAAKRTHEAPSRFAPSRFASCAREHFEDFASTVDVVRGEPMDRKASEFQRDAPKLS